MKTIITSIAMAVLCLINYSSYAQPCSITDPSITITHVNPNNCQVTFDLTFTANINTGNKHAVIHLWQDPGGSYPATITYPATATETALASGTLAIANPGGASPVYEPSYPSSLGTLTSPYLVPSEFKWSGSNTARTFTFKDLVVTLSSCATTAYLKGDIYATQNDQNASGGCVNRGAFYFAANEPAMRGLMFCSSPRSFSVSFSTLKTTTITYEVYKDVAPYGIFDENDRATENLLDLTDASGTSTSKTVVNPAQPANQFTTYGPITYSPQPNGSQFGVWIVAQTGGNIYNNILLIDNTCASLPVQLKSFTLERDNQRVNLKWETTSEMNNAGFHIQRRTGTDNWKEVAFVPSRTETGTTSNDISYQYTDLNLENGITQYRLKQVDIDGKASYSDIKAIKGLGQNLGGITVFPNPAPGGNFSVLMTDDGLFTVEIVDMNGRVLLQYSDVRGSKSISGLKPGQYLVIAHKDQTAERRTTKVVVK